MAKTKDLVVGDRIKLTLAFLDQKYGTVTKVIEQGYVLVRWDSDLGSPVHPDNLERLP